MSECIGLDVAYRATGWAYRVDAPYPWHHGVIACKGKDPLIALDIQLCSTIEDARANGVRVAMLEIGYAGSNRQVYAKLNQAFGVARVACSRLGLRVVEVNAKQWQSAYSITGKREACKRGAEHIAVNILGAKYCKSQDEMDAVCIADYGNLQEACY